MKVVVRWGPGLDEVGDEEEAAVAEVVALGAAAEVAAGEFKFRVPLGRLHKRVVGRRRCSPTIDDHRASSSLAQAQRRVGVK